MGEGTFSYPEGSTVALKFKADAGWYIATAKSAYEGAAFDLFTQRVLLEYMKPPSIKHEFTIPLDMDGDKIITGVFSNNPIAPAFTQQPWNRAAQPGQEVRFSAEADGIPAPTYQWQKNGIDIDGATQKELSIPSVGSGDAATYRCVARNSMGATNSNDAVLQISDAVRFELDFTFSGSGTVTFDPSGSPGADGKIAFLGGTQVSVTVEAAPGWRIYSMNYVSGAPVGAPWDSFTAVLYLTMLNTVPCTSFRTSDWIPPVFLLMDRDKGFHVEFVPLDYVPPSPVAPSFTFQPQNQVVVVGGNTSFTALAVGNPAPSYRWQVSTDGGTVWINIADDELYSGVTTTTLSITGVTEAMNGYQYHCCALNSAGIPISMPATLTLVRDLASWRQQYWGTTADAGPAANHADPDIDGRCNLLEYALGSVPTMADSGRPADVGSVTDGAGTYLTLTFNRIADPTLTYTVEASDDLTTWSAIGTSTGAQNVAGPVVVTDSETVENHPRRFLRLRVSN